MTKEEFIRASKMRRLKPRTLEAIKLVLVDQMRIVDVARQMDMKPQQIGAAARLIEAEHQRIMLEKPVGDWVSVTVCVPPECVAEIMEIENRAKKEHARKQWLASRQLFKGQ